MHRALPLLACVLLAPAAGAAPPAACDTFARFDPEKCIRADPGPKRTGTFFFAGALAIEGGWDSNPGRAVAETAGDGAGAFAFRLLPRMEAGTPEPSAVDFELEATAELPFYAPGVGGLGPSDAAGVTAGIFAELGRRNAVAVLVRERLRQSAYGEDAAISLPQPNVWNAAGGGLRIRPGGGARIEVAYDFVVERYEELQSADSTRHEMDLLLAWPFHRLGELYADVQISVFAWERPTDASGPGALPLRAVLGVAGYPFSKLLGILELGYGDTLHEDEPRYRSLVARSSLTWRFGPAAYLGMGYERGFRASTWARFYGTDRIHLRGGFRVADRVSVAAAGSFAILSHGRYLPADPLVFASHDERTAQRVDGSLRVDVDVYSWLGVFAGYLLELDHSSFRRQVLRPSGLAFDSSIELFGYVRHRVFGGLRARF